MFIPNWPALRFMTTVPDEWTFILKSAAIKKMLADNEGKKLRLQSEIHDNHLSGLKMKFTIHLHEDVSPELAKKVKKQVRSDYDASELEILGYLGILGQFGRLFDEFVASDGRTHRPSYREVWTHLKMRDRWTDGRIDGRTDPLIEIRGRI